LVLSGILILKHCATKYHTHRHGGWTIASNFVEDLQLETHALPMAAILHSVFEFWYLTFSAAFVLGEMSDSKKITRVTCDHLGLANRTDDSEGPGSAS
jgi:hypothetical protein